MLAKFLFCILLFADLKSLYFIIYEHLHTYYLHHMLFQLIQKVNITDGIYENKRYVPNLVFQANEFLPSIRIKSGQMKQCF